MSNRWVLAVASLLSLAHRADAEPTIVLETGQTFALVERACKLLRAKTRSTDLLHLLGADEIRNGKEGWNGRLNRSRFVAVTAWGAYDDNAVAESVIFYLPKQQRLSKKEVLSFSSRLATGAGSGCELQHAERSELGHGYGALGEKLFVTVAAPLE